MDEREVLVAAPVRVERHSGAQRSELSKLRRLLSAFAALEPGTETWQIVERWIDRAVAAGQRFGWADLPIAALAAEQGAELWSLDRDFARMERLGFVRRHAWARGEPAQRDLASTGSQRPRTRARRLVPSR